MLSQRLRLAYRTRVTFSGMLLLLVAAVGAQAQPSFNVTFGGTLDSFTPAASVAENRQNLSGAVNAEHLFADGRGRVHYDLDGGEYDSPGDWSYFQNNVGFTYRFGGAGADARKLFLNASFVSRNNGEAWTSAEYKGLGAGVNAEFHPHATSTLKLGTRADYRRFADYTALTQFEQRAFASLLHSFESRTTLVGEVQVGFKRYDGTIASELPGTTTETITTGGRGIRMGMGPGVRFVSHPAYALASESGSAGLASGLVRLAQSLSDRTGMHAQAVLRQTFGSVPPALVTTPAGFFEDGVYDDPFASNAVFLQAGMKHAFANNAEISATAWWAEKNFTGAVALGEDGLGLPGSPLRADTATLALVSWAQPLFASRTGALSLSADIGYRFIRQRSNDAFYNYTSHALALGFSVGY